MFPLVFQIAAKIGGDAGPPLNNNAASDGFPFTAQKRQLEDAGRVTELLGVDRGTDSPTVAWIEPNVYVALDKSVCQMETCKC